MTEAAELLCAGPGHVRSIAKKGYLRTQKEKKGHLTYVYYSRADVLAQQKRERDERAGCLTTDEASAYLKRKGVTWASANNVRNWIKKGDLSSFTSKYTRKIRLIEAEELDRFAAERLKANVRGGWAKEEPPKESRSYVHFHSTVDAQNTATYAPYTGLAQAIVEYLLGDYKAALIKGDRAQIQYFESCIKTRYFCNLTLCKVEPESVIYTYRKRYGGDAVARLPAQDR